MVAARSASRAFVSLCALSGALAFAATPAPAAITHHFLSKITEVPAEGPNKEAVELHGPISKALYGAVESGDLWVSEFDEKQFKFTVNEWNAATGAFIHQFPQDEMEKLTYPEDGMAIGDSTGETELYLGTDTRPEERTEGSIAVFNAAGRLQGIWTGADTPSKHFGCFACNGSGGVAVDRSTNVLEDWAAGDVLVASPEEKVVDVFRPEAEGKEKYLTQLTGIPGEPFGKPTAVAVQEGTGALYVLDGSVVDVFKPTSIGESYEFVRQINGTPSARFETVFGNQVDVGGGEGNGDLYVETKLPGGNYEERIISQFGSGGQYLGQLTGTAAGEPFHEAQGVAINPESHELYVTDKGAIDFFTPDLVIPDVATTPPTGIRPTGHGLIELTFHGAVNPDKSGAATCKIELGTTKAFGEEAPCLAGVPEGESPEDVTANASDLQPDTTYYYRLAATNGNGTNQGVIQQITTPGPGMHSESVSTARAEAVTFDATVNPHRAPTTFYIQYGPSTEYSNEAPAPPGTSIGSGEGDKEVTQHVQGLRAATNYHYRVVAVSEMQAEVAPGTFETVTESFFGPDQTFTTQTVGLPLTLPDGRAWEMVSPPQKEGAALAALGEEVLVMASANGDAFVEPTAFQPTEPEPEGANWLPYTFFGRGPHGWTSKVISPRHTRAGATPIGNGAEYYFFSEDLSKGLLKPFDNIAPLSPEASETSPYIRTDYLNGDPTQICSAQSETASGTHCYRPLVSGCPATGQECAPAVKEHADVPPGAVFGGTTNGECQVSQCGPDFLVATPDLSHALVGSQASLTEGTGGGVYEWTAGKLAFVGKGGGYVYSIEAPADHVISGDGSRVIFSGESEGHTGLLLRDMPAGKTIQIGQQLARYLASTPDDSRVFYREGYVEGGSSNGALQECHVREEKGSLSCATTDLTPGAETFEGMPGISEDGSYVYFFSKGVLASGATEGAPNLYVRHEGRTNFIASLAAGDIPDWCKAECLTARVSRDGRYLAFMSSRDLTGYNTTDANSKRPDAEVYLYHAAASAGEQGKLVCASCNPTGSRPVGIQLGLFGGEEIAPVSFGEGVGIASNVPPWTRSGDTMTAIQPRYLSDSGRLFFNSNDALVPQDVNGTEDVYEYEPPGVGDCSTSSVTYSERSGGCVGLISSGTSNNESGFVGASETGGDVFFITLAKLVPQDFDNAYDIYDAHECTKSSPCIPPAPVPPPPCDTADSCKAAPSPQPALFGAPASATFSGTGNLTPESKPAGKPAAKPRTTRAQKLARALRACGREHSRSRRRLCERQARRAYGSKAARRARWSGTTSTRSGR